MRPSDLSFGLRSELLKEGWNSVLIKCHHEKLSGLSKDVSVKCIGVHAYDHGSYEPEVDWDRQCSQEFCVGSIREGNNS